MLSLLFRISVLETSKTLSNYLKTVFGIENAAKTDDSLHEFLRFEIVTKAKGGPTRHEPDECYWRAKQSWLECPALAGYAHR